MAHSLYNPKSELFKAYPEMQALSQEANDVMEGAEETLSEREFAGCDTSWARAHLYEAEWRINCASDCKAARDAVERLKKALVCTNPPDGLTQDCGGSFAPGTDVFFLKLDRSTDQLLARQWPWRLHPTFLDPINDPGRMVTYLQDLCWSDVVRCGRDNRKELNLAVSVIARLVLQGGQAGYLSGPGFVPVFERFVRDWQDPFTGFFGVTYIIDSHGNEIRTTDLSLTFHMVRYAPHLVRWWPQLIDTLLAIKDQQYPQGWLEKNSKMSDHNNYDVAELFFRGWPYMRPDQRRQASQEVAKMLKWCLEFSVRDTGEVINPDKGDMVMDSYYFAAAFLDTIGYFDTSRRFWAGKGQLPADTEPLRKAMIAQLARFNSDLTVVDDTRERLGAGPRPWSNAIL
ncbi:MAG: hypothetical protein JO320_08975 [Alphaproteobacteria bacterium]|nr:hypothetical protein [Alphaproteobacteria bacterium]MBV9375170.1 hypothetical protein [Alphaproteobacteria bacterium]